MKDEASIILVVDDNAINLSVLFEYLEESGFEIAVAQSGDSALEQLQHVRPDLILLDVMMPGIDGFETCRRLKKAEATKDIPVIFMTALTDEIDKMKGFLAGGVDYITKPLHHEEVLVRINAHLTVRKLHQQIQTQNALVEEQKAIVEQKDEQLKKLYACNSIFSHEFKSPLNTLFGIARLIDENIDHYSKEEIRSNASKLRASAEKLYALRENLLIWSNIQRDTLEFNPKPISVDEIVAYHILLFTRHARQKKITLSSSLQENTLVYADYDTVNAVIRNLISNALEFTFTGGKVNISARHAEDHVVISVSDTGLDISKENLPHLFRIDNPTQHETGTGKKRTSSLGLLLCKELIEKNGGRIWVESEIEKGATFRFTLPKEHIHQKLPKEL